MAKSGKETRKNKNRFDYSFLLRRMRLKSYINCILLRRVTDQYQRIHTLSISTTYIL